VKKTWFNRLLISYVPILFITITIIIFISVSIMSQISFKETEKANHVFSKYVTDSMDTSLHDVERLILENMVNNDEIKAFFEPNSNQDQRLQNYEVSREISKIMSDNLMIDSIYLYRNLDQMVISKNLIEKLDDFQDRKFIHQAYSQPTSVRWSPVRNFAEYQGDVPYKVISMSKKAMLPFGDQGVVIVNVKVKALLNVVDQMINKDITFMNIISDPKEQVYPEPQTAAEPGYDAQSSQGKVVTEYYSSYMGWHFSSGLKTGRIFSWVSFVSRIWLGIGISTILLSVLYIVYITRRNYRPIENLLGQIQSYQTRNDTKGSGNDEFSFIGKVLGNLFDQTQVYEKQYQEDLLVRKRQFFLEVIEGEQPVSMENWRKYMNRFNLQSEFQHLTLAVVELDHYPAFQKEYKRNDQNLLKFGMTNVLNEFSSNEGQALWSEWVSGQRLYVLFISDEMTEDVFKAKSLNILDKFRTWITVNLKLSLTIGLSGSVNQLNEVPRLFEDAITALQYKMSLGMNQVIRYEGLSGIASKDTSKYVQMTNAMIHDFRITSPYWETILEQFFDQLEEDVLKDVEIQYVLTYLLRIFNKQMAECSLEVAQAWMEQIHPTLQHRLDSSETLEEIRPHFDLLLKELYGHYLTTRESSSHYNLVNNIRDYIENNYANPELSLNHISDKFDVNGKYASQLFKEELGMKFVDFLVNLRMEHAKTLLLQTDESINAIAIKVGYIHSISFGRTFKKVVGVTPGDFRKYMNE
jgi:two-component system response regulator YesN